MQYVLDHEDKRAYLKVVAGWEDGGGDSRVFPLLVPCTPGYCLGPWSRHCVLLLLGSIAQCGIIFFFFCPLLPPFVFSFPPTPLPAALDTLPPSQVPAPTPTPPPQLEKLVSQHVPQAPQAILLEFFSQFLLFISDEGDTVKFS